MQSQGVLSCFAYVTSADPQHAFKLTGRLIFAERRICTAQSIGRVVKHLNNGLQGLHHQFCFLKLLG